MTGPLVVAAFQFLAAASWAVALAADPAPLAPGSGALIAIGLVTYGGVTAAALLLSRGTWTKPFAMAVIGGELALGLALGLDHPTEIVALVMSGVALALVNGPWLRGWLRLRPVAGGPPYEATALALALVALIPIAGIAAPEGPRPAHLALAVVAAFTTLAYTRATLPGLWSARLVVPVVGAWAASASPWWGAALVLAGVGVTTGLAWRRAAAIAVSPLMSSLPGPRVHATRTGEAE